MKRKLNIPKNKQCAGLRKALRNPNTPRQFLPSLRKRLKKLTGALIFLLAIATPGARAQSNLISVNQLVMSGETTAAVTPNSSSIGCTPSVGSPCGIRNLNQTIHTLTYLISGTCTSPTLDLRLEGSNDGTTFFAISQDAVDIPTNPASQTAKSGGVTATGSFPVLRANLVAFSCTGGGTISVWYSGYSTSAPPDSAIFQQANPGRQMLWQNVATNTAIGSLTISTPFENASGSVWIMCDAACPAGMTIAVSALPLVNVTSPTTFGLSTINVSASTGWQKFDITDAPVNVLQITVVGAGTGTVKWTAIYNFVPSTSQINGALNLNCLTGCINSVTGLGDPCQSPAILKTGVVVSTTTDVTLVSGVTGQSIFVCGFSVTLSGGGKSLTAHFESGTQSTTPCDTTAVAMTGEFIPQNATDAATMLNSGGYTVFKVPSGKDLCIFPNASGPATGGVLTYVRQ